jgi:hypothetical protein
VKRTTCVCHSSVRERLHFRETSCVYFMGTFSVVLERWEDHAIDESHNHFVKQSNRTGRESE